MGCDPLSLHLVDTWKMVTANDFEGLVVGSGQ